MQLRDKVAIVTGSGTGIGAAIAKLFAKEGAKIVVVDRITGEDTVREIRTAGGEAVLSKADVRDAEAVRLMVDETVSTYESLDILINNAGVLVVGDVVSIEEEDWDRCIDTKLKGAYLVSKYTIPYMIKRGGGIIVNTSSAAAFSPGKGYSSYGTANAGMVMLTKCMALDFASKNIRINCICPGPVDTPMIMPSDSEGRKIQLERWKKHLPAGRVGRPEEIASAVLYLVSKEAEFITGTALLIDGGRVLVGINTEAAGERSP